MNTNSNTYTVIYSIILVVVVAAVLAFAAKFLQPTQDENIKKSVAFICPMDSKLVALQ